MRVVHRTLGAAVLVLSTACGGDAGDEPAAQPIQPFDAPDAGHVPDAAPGHGGRDASAVDVSCWERALTLAAQPASFPARMEPTTNPTTLPGVALGRRLFFDPALSADNQVSCATCHEPEHGFSVPDALTTRGVSGKALVRHAPSLWNTAWLRKGLFWDGGAKNLESLGLAPLTHPDEMGHTAGLEELVTALREDASYTLMFERAFGSSEITISQLLRALAQYQRNLVAADARWDHREQTPLSDDEQRGEQVFMQHCARCHTPGLFTDGDFHNNGLDAQLAPELTQDVRTGRARVSLDLADLAKFKTPGLRDTERSAPYMHDGRFATLEQVIEHYRFGMVASSTLDEGFAREGSTPGIIMSDEDAAHLRAFLATLSQASLQPNLMPPACASNDS